MKQTPALFLSTGQIIASASPNHVGPEESELLIEKLGDLAKALGLVTTGRCKLVSGGVYWTDSQEMIKVVVACGAAGAELTMTMDSSYWIRAEV